MENKKPIRYVYNNINKRRQLYLEALEYLNGVNKQKDIAKAFELMTESADMGFPYAISAIGGFYSKGLHVDLDPELAISYTMKAYKMNNPKASYNLYLFYKYGDHVTKDEKLAAKYLDNSIDFSCQEILKGESIALEFLKNFLGADDQYISKFIEGYISNPLCDICFENIKSKNQVSTMKLSIEGFNDGEDINPNQMSLIMKSDPLVVGGHCCTDCYIKYVQPTKIHFQNDDLSHGTIDEILGNYEIIKRLELLNKIAHAKPFFSDFLHPEIIYFMDRLYLSDEIRNLLKNAPNTMQSIIKNPNLARTLTVASLIVMLDEFDDVAMDTSPDFLGDFDPDKY